MITLVKSCNLKTKFTSEICINIMIYFITNGFLGIQLNSEKVTININAWVSEG